MYFIYVFNSNFHLDIEIVLYSTHKITHSVVFF